MKLSEISKASEAQHIKLANTAWGEKEKNMASKQDQSKPSKQLPKKPTPSKAPIKFSNLFK